MTGLAAILDVAIALAIAGAAAAWLVWRGVRTWRAKSTGCGCGSTRDDGCPAASGLARDLKSAAARAVGRTRGPSPR